VAGEDDAEKGTIKAKTFSAYKKEAIVTRSKQRKRQIKKKQGNTRIEKISNESETRKKGSNTEATKKLRTQGRGVTAGRGRTPKKTKVDARRP